MKHGKKISIEDRLSRAIIALAMVTALGAAAIMVPSAAHAKNGADDGVPTAGSDDGTPDQGSGDAPGTGHSGKGRGPGNGGGAGGSGGRG